MCNSPIDISCLVSQGELERSVRDQLAFAVVSVLVHRCVTHLNMQSSVVDVVAASCQPTLIFCAWCKCPLSPEIFSF